MPDKLTKAEIIDKISEKLEINKKNIHRILDCFTEEIKKGLLEDKIVELRGFGTFEIKLRKGRIKARNPKTGEVFPVENHGAVIFRPGQEMKNSSWSLRK